MDSNSPARRPRAPTITVDTAADAGNDTGYTESINASPSPLDDTNTLAVPTEKSRAESWSSSPSTKVGTDHEHLSKEVEALRKGDQQEILKPDPGEEAAFHVENNPFAFSPGQLAKLINPKNLPAFVALGGLPGLEKGLRTDSRAGLSADEGKLSNSVSFEEATSTNPGSPKAAPATEAHGHGKDAFPDRKRVYGPNRLPETKSKVQDLCKASKNC